MASASSWLPEEHFCTQTDHKSHQIVSLKEANDGKKAELGKTDAEVQQMIRERQVKIHEVERSVVLSKKAADREIADSVKVFTALISCIERSQAEVRNVIEEKQKSTEKQAEGFIKELQQEITQFEKISSELKQLSHAEDHIQLLQNFKPINLPVPIKDWTSIHPSSYVGTVGAVLDQLKKKLSKELEKHIHYQDNQPLFKDHNKTTVSHASHSDEQSEMVDQFRSSKRSSTNPEPAKPDEVSCDSCTEPIKLKALKSCLVCLASYCETHLEPHLRATAFKQHKLINPVKNLENIMCQKHDRPLELKKKDMEKQDNQPVFKDRNKTTVAHVSHSDEQSAGTVPHVISAHTQGSVAAQSVVRVKVILKGQTFNCHRTLLQRVRKLGGLHVDESARVPKVVIVFFPVSSHHMTDIEEAMKDVVPGGAAVILVMMHHTQDINYPNIVRTLGGDCVWDFVNVLYHEKVPGRLQPCAFNEQAVVQLRGVLLKHSSVVSPVAATTAATAAVASVYGSYGGGSSGKIKCGGGGPGGVFGCFAGDRNKTTVAHVSHSDEQSAGTVPHVISAHTQVSVAAQSTVRVKAIIKGQTFDCHRTLLQRVRQLGGLHVDETTSGPKVVIVFCPVASRHMTDIEAAMKDVVPGGAAVILVVMHHTQDINYTDIVRRLDGNCVWDFVNVLYHETVPGLLTCTFNEKAVAQLHGALLKHSSVVSPVAAAAAAGSSGKTKGGRGGGVFGWFAGGK